MSSVPKSALECTCTYAKLCFRLKFSEVAMHCVSVMQHLCYPVRIIDDYSIMNNLSIRLAVLIDHDASLTDYVIDVIAVSLTASRLAISLPKMQPTSIQCLIGITPTSDYSIIE